MMKKLDVFLASLGLVFIGLIVWDSYRSASHFPEGLWYTVSRNPDSYPAEIKADINQIRLDADQKLEIRAAEITEQIRKQIEDSNTGCISFSGLPNAICFGARQTVIQQPPVQP